MKRLLAWGALALVGATLTIGPVVFAQAIAPANTGIASFTGITVTGQGKFANGTAALPSITFESDPDTGIYRQGANAIGISNGGALKLTINSTGSIIPAADNTQALGANAAGFSTVYLRNIRDGNNTLRFDGQGSGGGNLYSCNIPNTNAQVAHQFYSTNTLTTDNTFIAAFHAGSSGASNRLLGIDKSGVLVRGAITNDAASGVATLVAGTVTVATTAVETGDRILLTHQGTGTAANFGVLSKGAIVADTSFVINSSNVADDDTVYWVIER